MRVDDIKYDDKIARSAAEDEFAAILSNGLFISEEMIPTIAHSIVEEYCWFENTDSVLNETKSAYNHFKKVYEDSNIEEEVDLDETIEKHDELNPLLFDKDKKLLPEIVEKVNEIVEKFKEDLDENNIKIKIKDIILTGSNANYNYTKDSDLDIHILADTKSFGDKDKLYKSLYDAYRTLFSKKYDISFYDIPVEIYVETEDTPLASGGVYSILDNDWKKEPIEADIPEFDQEAFDKEYSKWEAKCADMLSPEYHDVTEAEEIEALIDELYRLRQGGLSNGGEFNQDNLIFKELRNTGYLDQLKQLRDDTISRELSLESNASKQLSDDEVLNYKLKLTNAGGVTPEIDADGTFVIDNIPEQKAEALCNKISKLPYIVEAKLHSTGRHDFNSLNLARPGKPCQLYKISGFVKK